MDGAVAVGSAHAVPRGRRGSVGTITGSIPAAPLGDDRPRKQERGRGEAGSPETKPRRKEDVGGRGLCSSRGERLNVVPGEPGDGAVLYWCGPGVWIAVVDVLGRGVPTLEG